jgi:hypothetical protein
MPYYLVCMCLISAKNEKKKSHASVPLRSIATSTAQAALSDHEPVCRALALQVGTVHVLLVVYLFKMSQS